MNLIGQKAYVSLSGGLDSTTALCIAADNHGSKNVVAISIDYGQRHKKELDRASQICEMLEIEHRVIQLPNIPKSMLTDSTAEVPNASYGDLVGVSPTYVPFRNGLLLATLASIASPSPNGDEKAHIYFGAHAEDAENDAYPDCRLDFIGTMGAAIYIGSYHRVRLHAPLIEMTKAEVVLKGTQLNAPYELTWSCYKGEELHCGVCPTCRARKEAFQIAGVPDPTEYAA
jgi:7-cyano-7-deazaguanine synthase